MIAKRTWKDRIKENGDIEIACVCDILLQQDLVTFGTGYKWHFYRKIYLLESKGFGMDIRRSTKFALFGKRNFILFLARSLAFKKRFRLFYLLRLKRHSLR